MIKRFTFLDKQDLVMIKRVAHEKFLESAVDGDETDDAFIARCWVEAFGDVLLQNKMGLFVTEKDKVICQI